MIMNLNPTELLSAMSHPLRLAILHRLSKGTCCVEALGELLSAPQPNISQHLRLLLDSGLVQVERRGRRRCYSLSDKRIKRFLKILEDMTIESADKIV